MNPGWFGHLTCKTVRETTYNVSSGTLNHTIPMCILENRFFSVVILMRTRCDVLCVMSRDRQGDCRWNESGLRGRLYPTCSLCPGQRGSHRSAAVPRRRLPPQLSAECILQRHGTPGVAGVRLVQQGVLVGRNSHISGGGGGRLAYQKIRLGGVQQ